MEVPRSRELITFVPLILFVLGTIGAIVGLSSISENLVLGASETTVGLVSILGSFIAAGATFNS
jgi:hypothetical protein